MKTPFLAIPDLLGCVLLILLGTLVWSCAPKLVPPLRLSGLPTLTAVLETESAPAKTEDDAADDPAIWYNAANPANSAVVGTIKDYGLEVYDLNGKRLHTYPGGDPNNVDIRSGFPLHNGQKIDLVVCSDRSDNSIWIQRLDPTDRSLKPVPGGRIATNIGEVYGICLYVSRVNNRFYVIINGKDGTVQQYLMDADGPDGVRGTLVRTLKLLTQPEGLVADDELGMLYMGEEDRGIWRVTAEPDQQAEPKLLLRSGADNPNIAYDVEGLSIFYGADGTGYLLASSQGNYSYALFDRRGDNAYLGSFSIVSGTLDGVEETDGLDICSVNLGGRFVGGLLVVQDGWNYDATGKKTAQNFKYVDLRSVTDLTGRSRKP